jgi:hypothetical protein
MKNIQFILRDIRLEEATDINIRTTYFLISLYNFHQYSYINTSWGSWLSIVSDYELDDRAIEARSLAEVKNFPLPSVSRPPLGPTQSPLQWVLGVLSRG